MDKEKISVEEYIEDTSLLEISYIPFDRKLDIVNHILRTIIASLGYINSSLVRRIATETFIEVISNIDLSIKDDNGLSGYDQLCFHDELSALIVSLGNEYGEFIRILSEQIEDYNKHPYIFDMLNSDNDGGNNEDE